ncbi:MAG: cell division protein SepF [Candidatus Thermoplasmatota archaeon]|nr:cell division protein SepF [Candidatus Thermoplasmatota archaeon]
MTILKKKSFAGADESAAKQAMAAEQYIDLTDMVFEDESVMGPEGARTVVKVGELFRYDDLTTLTKEVYQDNIVIVDFTSIANDDLTMKRVTAELKSVARDVDGDVAGVGKNLLMVTPRGVKIDRNKIKGGF